MITLPLFATVGLEMIPPVLLVPLLLVLYFY